jgi:hypothetical protein
MQIEIPDFEPIFTIEDEWDGAWTLSMNGIVAYSKKYDVGTNYYAQRDDFHHTIAKKFRRLLED